MITIKHQEIMSLWQKQFWQNMLLVSWQIKEFFVVKIDMWWYAEHTGLGIIEIYVEKRAVSLWEYWLFVIWFEMSSFQDLDEKVRIHFFRELTHKLQDLCVKQNWLFVQIETLDYTQSSTLSVTGSTFDKQIMWVSLFRVGVYKKFIPPYTAVIDLTKSEEEMLADMKQKGRYNIRLAEKKWVKVSQVSKNHDNIKIFCELMELTTKRDKFHGNGQNYYESFLSRDNTYLYFSEHNWEVIAAAIFAIDGPIMYYYYWASANHKRNLMAPYLLQWKAILFGKEQGCQLYDFLWISSPMISHDALTWVTNFKIKFTSDTRLVSKAYVYKHKKLKYALIQFLKYFKR